MANAQKVAFFERYAAAAMEQQQRYGIPASVTLAQMYLESGGGTSKLAREGNNYFGIKCSGEWLAAGKPYSLHNDDRPNEKFCNYATVEESIDHHSKILSSSRYTACQRCASDDYRGWANGLQAAGYATNPRYAQQLISDIEDYDLHRYDMQAAQGQPLKNDVTVSGHYCFPLADNNLVLTDGYGIGATSYRGHSHNGIDLRAKYQDVFATEDHGRVVGTGYQSSGGNYVTVEYDRADGASYRVSYCHLDKISVSKGDTVNAGTVLGVSGNSGNSTGPHLHLTVKYQKEGQEAKVIDPLVYLAEISVRGNLSGTVVKKGMSVDLLTDLKKNADVTLTPGEVLLAQQSGNGLSPYQQNNIQQYNALSNALGSDDPNNILAYLMKQNQSGQGGDLISNLISALFMSAMSMAMILDRNDAAESETHSLPMPLTEEEKNSTVIQRRREGVDAGKARDLALINFDAEFPEQHQDRGQRLA